MDKNKQYGYWCRSNKTFYWLDTGVHTLRNDLDTLLRTLMARELVEFDPGPQRPGSEPYRKMTMADAEEKNYEVVRIPLNARIGKEKPEEETKSIWKR